MVSTLCSTLIIRAYHKNSNHKVELVYLAVYVGSWHRIYTIYTDPSDMLDIGIVHMYIIATMNRVYAVHYYYMYDAQASTISAKYRLTMKQELLQGRSPIPVGPLHRPQV